MFPRSIHPADFKPDIRGNFLNKIPPSSNGLRSMSDLGRKTYEAGRATRPTLWLDGRVQTANTLVITDPQ